MSATITMSRLGRYGRWANQILQHAFVQCYAKRYGIDYAVPAWVGNDIFGFQDPPITKSLPDRNERYYNDGYCQRVLIPEQGEFHDHDFVGYGQVHTSWLLPFRGMLQGEHRPVPERTGCINSGIQEMRRHGKTVIGLQIRRSDYGHGIQYRTPVRWYKQWLRENLGRFESPVLFVESEDRNLWELFGTEFGMVWTSERLGIPFATEEPRNYDHCTHFPEDKRHASPSFTDFFTNWWILANCDVLLISNSTYGFTAGMFSTRPQETWRSNLPAQTFIPFDPWWDNPMEYNSLNRWRGIPGTQVDNNPFAPSIVNRYPAAPDPEEPW